MEGNGECPCQWHLHDAVLTLGGFFDGHVARQMTQAKWTNIPYPVVTTLQCGPSLPTPDMRGGHQMCIDADAGQLYLYGGWNGTKELGDLWQFTIATNKWACLSVDSSQEVSLLFS